MRYIFIATLVGLAGCAKYQSSEDKQKSSAPESPQEQRKFNFGSLAGPEGITLSSNIISGRKNQIIGMRVNPHLWEATLSVLEFMPLISSDAHGGVLITDWTPVENNPNEQVKITARIKSCDLNANALSVIIHKRFHRGNGVWLTRETNSNVNNELETLILEKARDIKSKRKHSCGS